MNTTKFIYVLIPEDNIKDLVDTPKATKENVEILVINYAMNTKLSFESTEKILTIEDKS